MRPMMPLARSVVGLPRRGVAAVLLAAGLLAAGLLGTDSPAAAQAVTTFISNTEQPRGITFWVRATAFTTGTSTYTLSSVGVDTMVQTGSVTPVVAIYGDNGGNPGTLLATMTTGVGTIIRSGVSTFTAPAGTTLSASTTYWVVTSNSAATDGQGFKVAIINNATLDSGAAAGWSIGSARFKNDITDTSWAGTSFRIRFQIRGTTGSTTSAPTVANTIPDQAATVATPFSYVFLANTFDDVDGDTLSYMATQPDDTALPTWLAFADTTRTFSGTPQAGDVGTVSVKVTASDGNGESVSDGFDIVVNASVPGAPTGLTATAGGTTRINLTWTSPSSNGGATISGYKIEVSSDGGSNWTDLVADTNSPATTYPHTGLAAGATRHYRVSAINTAGTGGSSNIANATTVVTAPGAPTGLTATASGTTINLSWTAPASNGGATISGYKIEVSSDGGSNWTDRVANSPATAYQHTGLAAGATRHYRVSAINTAGTGGSSNIANATIASLGGGGGGGGGGSVGGGGGGAVGAGGPSPSVIDFEWTVTRDVEELAAGNTMATGVWSDGETLWVADNADGAGDAVYAYDLATGERLEEREFELAEANRAPRGIWSDRETVWVSDSGQERLFAYDLASGERVEEREIELDAANGDARGIWSGGETMWVLDGGQEIAVYVYDLASGELIARYALDDANDDPHGIWSDGVTIWVSDHNAKRLFAYRLEDGELVRNSDEEFTELSGASNNSPRGLWSDGAVMYVADAERRQGLQLQHARRDRRAAVVAVAQRRGHRGVLDQHDRVRRRRG